MNPTIAATWALALGALSLSLTATSASAGKLHKCEVDGKWVYQDQPCVGKGEDVFVLQGNGAPGQKKQSRDEIAALNCLRYRLPGQIPANPANIRLEGVKTGWDTFDGVAASWVEASARVRNDFGEAFYVGPEHCVLAGDHKTVNKYLNK